MNGRLYTRYNKGVQFLKLKKNKDEVSPDFIENQRIDGLISQRIA